MLAIHLIGQVRVFIRQPRQGETRFHDAYARDRAEAEPVRLGHYALGLVAYLALNRTRANSRDCLSGLFWGDEPVERSKACLSTTLWRLRRALEPDDGSRGTYILSSGGDSTVGINTANIAWLDVAALEESVRPLVGSQAGSLGQPEIDRAERAIVACAGSLMDDFYEDWVVAERERVRCLRQDGLARLVTIHHRRGAFDRAISCARSLLQEDPLREDTHRELIRLYSETGQRVMALRQFESCRAMLIKELGIEPMPETQHLAAAAAAGTAWVPHRPSEASKLEEALAAVHAAQEQLDYAMRLLGQIHRQRT